MARADLLVSMVDAWRRGDRSRFQRATEAVIAEERQRQHGSVADRIERSLREGPASTLANGSARDAADLLHESIPRRSLDDLVLSEPTRRLFDEFVEEQHRADLLRSYSLEPRHRVLLTGPPGTGKTSLAEALATALMLPYYRVRYEALIGSYLGETASRLGRVFDFVRARPCLLFLDELEVVAKERGDTHETGEIKRLVSSLLLGVDELPSYVVVVTASNHPELLDRAVWRRFQVRVELPKPSRAQIKDWLAGFEQSHKLKLGLPIGIVAGRLDGLSFAEVEEFGLDVLRRHVLSLPDANVRAIVDARLNQLRLQPGAVAKGMDSESASASGVSSADD